MRLSQQTVEQLAQMICGKHGNDALPSGFDWPNFPYRSGPKLYKFFSEDCRILPLPDFTGTRITWAKTVLADINDGKYHHPRVSPGQLILLVVRKLLESVGFTAGLDTQRAVEDVNRVLAADGLVVRSVEGEFRIAVGAVQGGVSGLVDFVDIEKCLDDFCLYIKSQQRMTFWQSDTETGGHRWRSQPEQHAKVLLHTYLSSRFGGSAYTFEEIAAGAGRIDIFVLTPIGEKGVIELKMCGHRYAESYAQSGVEQLLHYAENMESRTAYLVVFDSRMREFGQGFREGRGAEHGITIVTKLVDVRPSIRNK